MLSAANWKVTGPLFLQSKFYAFNDDLSSDANAKYN